MLAVPKRAPLVPLLGLGLFVACNQTTTTTTTVVTSTSIVVVPEAFLGDAACGDEEGSLVSYQVLLEDVTDGLDSAEALDASPVVSCHHTVVFESVEPTHRYIATIHAFDQLDLNAAPAGRFAALDQDGQEVPPSWTTTCSGYDGEATGSLGGAGGEASVGLVAADKAAPEMRGCLALQGDFPSSATAVRLFVDPTLSGLACGTQPGQMASFTFSGEGTSDDADGGAAGSAGAGGAAPDTEGSSVPCGEPLILRGLEPNAWLTWDVLALEAEASAPTFAGTCSARTRLGATVEANCSLLEPL